MRGANVAIAVAAASRQRSDGVPEPLVFQGWKNRNSYTPLNPLSPRASQILPARVVLEAAAEEAKRQRQAAEAKEREQGDVPPGTPHPLDTKLEQDKVNEARRRLTEGLASFMGLDLPSSASSVASEHTQFTQHSAASTAFPLSRETSSTGLPAYPLRAPKKTPTLKASPKKLTREQKNCKRASVALLKRIDEASPDEKFKLTNNENGVEHNRADARKREIEYLQNLIIQGGSPTVLVPRRQELTLSEPKVRKLKFWKNRLDLLIRKLMGSPELERDIGYDLLRDFKSGLYEELLSFEIDCRDLTCISQDPLNKLAVLIDRFELNTGALSPDLFEPTEQELAEIPLNERKLKNTLLSRFGELKVEFQKAMSDYDSAPVREEKERVSAVADDILKRLDEMSQLKPGDGPLNELVKTLEGMLKGLKRWLEFAPAHSRYSLDDLSQAIYKRCQNVSIRSAYAKSAVVREALNELATILYSSQEKHYTKSAENSYSRERIKQMSEDAIEASNAQPRSPWLKAKAHHFDSVNQSVLDFDALRNQILNIIHQEQTRLFKSVSKGATTPNKGAMSAAEKFEYYRVLAKKVSNAKSLGDIEHACSQALTNKRFVATRRWGDVGRSASQKALMKVSSLISVMKRKHPHLDSGVEIVDSIANHPSNARDRRATTQLPVLPRAVSQHMSPTPCRTLLSRSQRSQSCSNLHAAGPNNE